MCLSQILHPKGRGEVTLQSANPYDPPIIDPKYYSASEDLDIVVAGRVVSNHMPYLKFNNLNVLLINNTNNKIFCILPNKLIPSKSFFFSDS